MLAYGGLQWGGLTKRCWLKGFAKGGGVGVTKGDWQIGVRRIRLAKGACQNGVVRGRFAKGECMCIAAIFTI